MSETPGSPQAPIRYIVPTHLNVEDKLINFFGYGLTARQTFLLLVGWSTAFNVWHHLGGLPDQGVSGLLVRLAIAAIPGLISLVIATTKVAGRHLELWLLVVLRYALLPKVYLWRSLASREEQSPQHQWGKPAIKVGGSKKQRNRESLFDVEDEQA